MNTPIYDFMCRYSNSDILRFHMPGHKGSSPEPLLDMLYKLDITEIKGADSLFEADGIIAESEKNASKLFNTAGTFYSVGGSTLCIQTMLALMKREGRTVIAARNVHRAFLNAAALLDLDVHWLYLKYSGGILTGEIPLDKLEKELMECKAPTCVYITSPDYTGKTADIEKISSICRKYNSPLLVDNAHGPHLAFFEKSRHPIARGADLCCDSAHKMLPALTGAAYLHISDLKYADKVKDAMTLFASTSPSYLIMASLDLCNRYIDEKIREDIKNIQQRVEKLRAKLSARLVFADSEPFHITINAAESGFDGKEFADLLRAENVECEYADSLYTVLLTSPFEAVEKLDNLETALKTTVNRAKRTRYVYKDFSVPKLKRAMSIRNAVFSTSETLNVENSEGRVCSAVNVPCPPAIPIAVSGEVNYKECIDVFLRYGIRNVNVVKE